MILLRDFGKMPNFRSHSLNHKCSSSMKQVKIVVLNITEASQRPFAEAELAKYLNEGWQVLDTHTDFEMASANRVILLTAILQK